MCKEERPLSTVRFLSDALSLKPTASTPLAEANQNDNGRTPEENEIFESIYLPVLMRTGLRITDQDREELRLRGLPPISEEYLTQAREFQTRRFYEQSREMQPALGTMQWLLDESMHSYEPEQYISALGLPTDNLGNQSFVIPTFEDVFPTLQPETWPSEAEDVHFTRENTARDLPSTHQPNTEGFHSATPNQLQALMDTVQTLSGNDARFGNEGYQALRSSSLLSERDGAERDEGEKEERGGEEGEMEEGKVH